MNYHFKTERAILPDEWEYLGTNERRAYVLGFERGHRLMSSFPGLRVVFAEAIADLRRALRNSTA